MNALTTRTRSMTAAIAHRGPDGDGVWVDDEAGVGIGQGRLAIMDLSQAGAQPMVSGCGRYVISYNGEAYNAEDIRPDLLAAGKRFRGHSDTEVILEACALWGVEATVTRLIGMFAMAIWDRQQRRLMLVRDRLGIKPLYWMLDGDRFWFASELKAIRAARPEWQPKLDRDALASYLRLNYVPHPHCIYQGVAQLPPGSILVLDRSGEPRQIRYWTLEEIARDGQSARLSGDQRDATDRLDVLLTDAVKRRVVADVPLGAFLSGGIDSSIVVALMQKGEHRRVRTFSIGFQEDSFDEAKHAAAIARHLGTDHTELYVDWRKALDVVPCLPEMFDEPFGDSSQIPTHLVSKMARQHVTVALSGDGGDEMFAGYNRYLNARVAESVLENVPRKLRMVAASLLKAVPPATWDRIGKVVPRRVRPAHLGDKLHKMAGALGESSLTLFRRLVSEWPNPNSIVQSAHEYRGLLWDEGLVERVPDYVERMQYLDSLTYLPDDILTKVDRASMAVGLETRVPLIDHRVVAFSWTLPPALKLKGRTGKYLLREVLSRYVPRGLVERPKMGFSVPIDTWLRGPLRDWAEDLLDPRTMQSDGLLDHRPVQGKWQEHLAGRRNWQYPLWNILMFQAWKRRWMP
jgi:asparagine synthase (glutamine-hydrolysing)